MPSCLLSPTAVEDIYCACCIDEETVPETHSETPNLVLWCQNPLLSTHCPGGPQSHFLEPPSSESSVTCVRLGRGVAGLLSLPHTLKTDFFFMCIFYSSAWKTQKTGPGRAQLIKPENQTIVIIILDRFCFPRLDWKRPGSVSWNGGSLLYLRNVKFPISCLSNASSISSTSCCSYSG